MNNLLICILSYKEHEKVHSMLDNYLTLVEDFDVQISFNFSNQTNELEILKNILEAISIEGWPISAYIRGLPGREKIFIDSNSSMNDGMARLSCISKNQAVGVYTHSISFKDQLADNLSEHHDYMWYLGAGDFPNFKAIEICKKVVFNSPKPSIVSFEVHHSPIKQNSFLCTQLLPRRLEAISASIYKCEVLGKLEEYSNKSSLQNSFQANAQR